jgi:predicted NBD/HSP70 family sugar kinase
VNVKQNLQPTSQGPGVVLSAIIRGEASTKSAIEAATGLSRPTVAERVRVLSEAGLVKETNRRMSSGGRPATVLEFDPRSSVSLCVDIGEERTRVALADLRAEIIVETVLEIEVAEGPRAVLSAIASAGRALLAGDEVAGSPLGGVGVGLPAPVDFGTGRTIGWSVMAGWDGYGVKEHLAREFGVPVYVDNDVNLLLLAEQRLDWPDEQHLLFVKIGTGIGSGLVVDGRINRGSLGAAGDIGHAHVSGYGDPLCRCGNRGCLEALAGGWALARDLRERDPGYAEVSSARDVVATIRRGDPDAVALIRGAGRILGEAVAFATSLLNPAVIVVGGELAKAGDQLMAGVRELVYQRSLPLATKNLIISPSRLGEEAGVLGAAFLVADELLDPDRIDRLLGTSPVSGRRKETAPVAG